MLPPVQAGMARHIASFHPHPLWGGTLQNYCSLIFEKLMYMITFFLISSLKASFITMLCIELKKTNWVISDQGSLLIITC